MHGHIMLLTIFVVNSWLVPFAGLETHLGIDAEQPSRTATVTGRR